MQVVVVANLRILDPRTIHDLIYSTPYNRLREILDPVGKNGGMDKIRQVQWCAWTINYNTGRRKKGNRATWGRFETHKDIGHTDPDPNPCPTQPVPNTVFDHLSQNTRRTSLGHKHAPHLGRRRLGLQRRYILTVHLAVFLTVALNIAFRLGKEGL